MERRKKKGEKKISENRKIDKRSKQGKKECWKNKSIFTLRCYCKFPYTCKVKFIMDFSVYFFMMFSIAAMGGLFFEGGTEACASIKHSKLLDKLRNS